MGGHPDYLEFPNHTGIKIQELFEKVQKKFPNKHVWEIEIRAPNSPLDPIRVFFIDYEDRLSDSRTEGDLISLPINQILTLDHIDRQVSTVMSLYEVPLPQIELSWTGTQFYITWPRQVKKIKPL